MRPLLPTQSTILWIYVVVAALCHNVETVSCLQKNAITRFCSSHMCWRFRGAEEPLYSGCASRRELFQMLSYTSLIFPSMFAVGSSRAAHDILPTVVLSGTVTLPEKMTVASIEQSITSNTNAALYVTVRPDTPDNVPAAILSGTRGKAPPVMAARFPSPTFPFEFQLCTPQNMTPEGTMTTTIAPQIHSDPSLFWWANDALIVSVRWDSDGVAATRSPDDLVGRAVWRRSSQDKLKIPLTGRGAFGRFITHDPKSTNE